MFQFVTVSHPDEIKDRTKQGKLRQHAIRSGIQRSKANRAKNSGGFIASELNENPKQLVRTSIAPIPKVALTISPSVSLVDPFNTLTGCPERLRALMRAPSAKQAGEPVFCITDFGSLLFQGMETIFRSALADPALFHALSLVFSLSANNTLPNIEVLTHRGYLLNGIRYNIKNQDDTPKVSTLVAMLMLIGYEYRIDGSNSESIAMHIRGVQSMVKLYKEKKVAVIDEVQRALFWQDLLSCLMADTARILDHDDFFTFRIPRDVGHQDRYVVPSGFFPAAQNWSNDFTSVIQDLYALCVKIDEECNPTLTPFDVFPIDNNQANIESRLVNCLHDYRVSAMDTDPIYEACIYAAYICTYKLSTGIWEGCYFPEVCVNQIIRCVTEATAESDWRTKSDVVLWLLFIAAGMTSRKEAKMRLGRLLHDLFKNQTYCSFGGWETTKNTLRQFIWSEYALEQGIHRYWKHMQSSLKTEAE